MIYIGSFIHTTHQEEPDEADRRHGGFTFIVDAENTEHALILFKDRILHFRESTRLFEGTCRIYLVRLLEIARLSQTTPVMFNYTSVAGDPVMPFISCGNPSTETEGCRILAWDENTPEIDGKPGEPFVVF